MELNGATPAREKRSRSVALVGPYGSGKSALFEAMLTAAGLPLRRSDPRARTMSTELRLGQCTYLGDSWSILDCPGSIEFAHEAAAALAVVDLAIVVCEPAASRAMALAPLIRTLADKAIPYLIFINKIDTLEGRVSDTIAALQAYANRALVLRQIPIRDGEAVSGYVDVVSERAYRYRKGEASELVQIPPEMRDREAEALDALVEVLADHDDALLEKVLEDVKPTPAEIYGQLSKDLAGGLTVEVLLGAAENDHGVRRLWKALRHEVPPAESTAQRRGIAPAGDPLAQVFKTVHAGHTGKLSYSRLWRGSIKDGATLNGSRLSGIYRFPGAEPTKVAEAAAGDLVAFARLETVLTGDTISTGTIAEKLPFPEPPPPVYSLAIATENRKDDVKVSGALQKLAEEDPALTVLHDQQTGETVLQGQGEMHLNAVVDKLARAYSLKITTRRPQVAYKETIRRAVHQHSRLKRQTGGHGQFADVKLDIAPRARGEGFLFTDKIVGGAVPKQYIPAVGEAAEEAARKGPFGYPVVDISVTLVDG
ncbi:MAG: elongation factor G, partial [Acetobacteraceae bacterium]|nr:elongation factor G [Acetobacteraceae bacterium]